MTVQVSRIGKGMIFQKQGRSGPRGSTEVPALRYERLLNLPYLTRCHG